jgi:hypothetical protein
MDELENNTFKKPYNRRKIELALGIIFLLLVAAVFVALLLNSSLQVTPETIVEENQRNLAETPLTVEKEFSYNNYKVGLAEEWEVGITFDGTKSEDIYCKDTTECNIYGVSNGINMYYISIPTSFTNTKFSSSTTEVTKSFSFGDIKFTVYNLQTLDIDTNEEEITDGSSGEVLVSEIVGCFDETVCFNSGRFSINSEENKEAVEKFYEFVGTVSLSK